MTDYAVMDDTNWPILSRRGFAPSLKVFRFAESIHQYLAQMAIQTERAPVKDNICMLLMMT